MKMPSDFLCPGGGTYNDWAAAWDFQQFDILTSVDSDEPLQPPFKLKNSKWCLVRMRMRRLIWGFVGRTYHIVGNLMHWLISVSWGLSNNGFSKECG